MKNQAEANSATDVAEETLQCSKVRLPRIMHVKTNLLNGIGEIRPGEGEVLQGTGEAPVGSRISHGITQISRQLRLSIDRSGAWLAISHPSPLQNVECILPLVKEQARRASLNSNAQEVVELTKILHSKLLLQRGDDALKQLLTGGGEHNIINIEQQVVSLIPTAVDEQRSVSLGLGEFQSQQERGKPRIPSPRSLLQTIERFVEPADHVRTTGVHKSRWLRAVDGL